MKKSVLAATTRGEYHLGRLTKESLVLAEKRLNNGKRKPILNVEHDSTLPPLGKILEGKVKMARDGNWDLFATQEQFSVSRNIILPDGTKGILYESESDTKPFEGVILLPTEENIVIVDPANFDSYREYKKYKLDLENNSDIPLRVKAFSRNAAIPDPQIWIVIAHEVVPYILGGIGLSQVRKFIPVELKEEISHDLVRFYKFSRDTIFEYSQKALPKNKAITVVFEHYGNPHIQLAAKIRRCEVDDLMALVSPENTLALVKQINELYEEFHAEKIQFLLDMKSRKWKFNYLLTDTGQVIGTEESFRRRVQKMSIRLTQLQ